MAFDSDGNILFSLYVIDNIAYITSSDNFYQYGTESQEYLSLINNEDLVKITCQDLDNVKSSINIFTIAKSMRYPKMSIHKLLYKILKYWDDVTVLSAKEISQHMLDAYIKLLRKDKDREIDRDVSYISDVNIGYRVLQENDTKYKKYFE